MYSPVKYWLLLVTFICVCSPSYPLLASEVCASHLLHQEKLHNDPVYKQHYEQMNEEIAKKTIEAYQKGNNNNKSSQQVYNIPIVVHIVHSTFTALGEGSNITDQQVYKAINQLNEAFRNTGDFREAHGVDTEISFCLAQQTPSGEPTNGIIRYVNDEFTHLEMTQEKENLGKQVRGWSTREYLNIWIVDEICKADYSDPCAVVAYSYTPTSIGEVYDGIVSEEQYFGVDERRTKVLIHEVGHYFNLLHTFQGGCRNNDCLKNGDFVCDTPPDNVTSFKTPCNQPDNSCDTDTDDTNERNPFRDTQKGGLGEQDDLIENYMDYSNRTCQNSFTQGQKVRMRTTIETQRFELLDSKGCESLYISDLGISLAEETSSIICERNLDLNLLLQNHGTLDIVNPTISYQLNNGTVMQFAWSGRLLPNEEVGIALPTINIQHQGAYTLTINAINDVGDDKLGNNRQIVKFSYLEARPMPLFDDFETGINADRWVIANVDDDKTWEQRTVSTCEENGTKNLFLNNYNYENKQGQSDFLYTALDLKDYADAQLSFDIAYLPRSAEQSDGFEVKVSKDCGVTFHTLYKRYGKYLSVKEEGVYATNYWQPPACDFWRNESISLVNYVGNEVILAFEAVNDNGNNIYLDNIRIDGNALLPCPIPQNISIQETSANSVYISWEATQNALEYVYRLKSKAAATWEQAAVAVNNGIEITNLLPNTDYEIEIQAKCSSSRFSGFSTTMTFNIANFTCIAPSNLQFQNVTERTATIQWETVPNATSYLVSYQLKEGSEQQQVTSDNFIQLSNLEQSNVYDVKVKTSCNNGLGESEFSATHTLILAGSCNQPSNLQVTNIGTTSAQITWDKTFNATNYRLQYKKSTKLNWVLINTSENSYLLEGLDPGTNYKVRVTAECPDNTNATSPIINFQTDSDCPDINNVEITNILQDRANINWPKAIEAAEYEITYQALGSGVRHSASTSSNSYELGGLLACTDYLIKIQVKCPNSTNPNIYELTFKTACETYCAAYSNNNQQFIESVSINDWSFTSDNNGGYVDLSNRVINTTRGAVLNLQLQAKKVARGQTPYWNVWVDWNQNRFFEESEQVLISKDGNNGLLLGGTSGKPKTTIEGTIFVPEDALLGATRIRVMLQDEDVKDPCAIIANGEVEDYTLQIRPPSGKKEEGIQHIHTSTNWDIAISPNPSRHKVQVNIQNADANSSYQVAIYDMNGRVMMPTQTLLNQQVLDVSSLAKGMYVVRVQTPNQLKAKKLMVW